MKTLEDLQKFVQENPIESAYLDFKRAEALFPWAPQKAEELAKDVSAFANSGGGTIIYGADEVRERDAPPRFARFDGGLAGLQVESVENVLNSEKYIYRRIEDIRIVPISAGDARLYLVIDIPRSIRAPHMHNPSKRYYKRHNFSSEPMLGYEIEDVRNRRFAPALEIVIDRKLLNPGNGGDVHHYRTKFDLLNSGSLSIKNFLFELSIPPFFRRCIQGPVPSREERLDGEGNLVLSKTYLEGGVILFPGQRMTALTIDYTFDQDSYNEVQRLGACSVTCRIFLDDSPPILKTIEWGTLENY